jgi:hypothetical protein
MKLSRYHIDVFVPEWSRNSILEFTKALSGKQLVCSYHATRKYRNMSREYQRVIRDLIATLDLELSIDYIFEFYANNKNEIKKVCYRFPMPELESDIIFVISVTGKIVTIFLNKNFDPHISLDKNLYTKGEKIESSIIANSG